MNRPPLDSFAARFVARVSLDANFFVCFVHRIKGIVFASAVVGLAFVGAVFAIWLYSAAVSRGRARLLESQEKERRAKAAKDKLAVDKE